MGTYILKRVLLMVPTFAAISLLVFIVLQFAPGTPGAEMVGAGGEASQSADLAGQKRESYRLFKEQFNLDKPVLFNNRFGLDTPTVTQTLDDILNRSETVSPGRRIEAQEEIEDWGQYAIPPLMAVLTTSNDRHLRALASQRLAINAQRPLKSLYKKSITPGERAENKEIAAIAGGENGGKKGGGKGKDKSGNLWLSIQFNRECFYCGRPGHKLNACRDKAAGKPRNLGRKSGPK